MADQKETARKSAGPLTDHAASLVTEAVKEAAGQVLDASGNAIKQGTESAKRGVGDAARFAQQQQSQAGANLERGAAIANDLADRSRAGFEGAFGSGAVMAQGMQQAMQLWSEFAQDSWRRQIEAAQELLHCRSFEAVMRIQSEFVRDSLERFAERSRRLTQLSSEIANDAMKSARDGQRMAAE